jgi:hypothetical protein
MISEQNGGGNADLAIRQISILPEATRFRCAARNKMFRGNQAMCLPAVRLVARKKLAPTPDSQMWPRSGTQPAAQLPLPLDLRRQQIFPTLRAVDVAAPEFRAQAVRLAIDQQRRVVAGGLEVAVEGLSSCSPYAGISVESMSRSVGELELTPSTC